MEPTKSLIIRKLNKYDILFCLLYSVSLLFLFNNTSYLNNLLGIADIYSNFSKPSCDPNAYFCRPLFIQFLYFYLSKFFNIDLIIFLQIFLLIISILLIRIQLINFKLNTWIINLLFLSLIINPKILKYSLSTMEEAFYQPCLLVIISLLIRFISKANIKNLIYLNAFIALLLLIRPGAAVFYLLIIIINIFYFIKIDNKTYTKKTLLSLIFFIILFSPFLINKTLNNNFISKKIKNNYFAMQAISSLIAKQKKELNDDSTSQFINNRIKKMNNIRQIEKLDIIPNLYFECIIFPAMNHVIFGNQKILNFFKNNDSDNLNKEIFNLYVKNFFKRPGDFLLIFQKCFFANSLVINILTKKEISNIEKTLINPIFDDNDKSIIKSFLKNSKNYSFTVKPIRIITISLLVTTLISLLISIKFLASNKNDKIAILSIIFFLMYYLIIILHSNLLYIQTRWFFTYYPLLMFSNLKLIELVSLFFKKFKFNQIK